MNPQRRGAVGLALLAAVAALGVSTVRHGSVQAQPEAACGEIAVTNPEAIIEVEVSQRFVIVLEANPTTGYSWAIAEEPDANTVQFVSKQYVSGGAGRPGAGGVECWTFQAAGPGETAIGMIYRRPFDPPQTPPARSATFPVNVSQAGIDPGGKAILALNETS